MSDVIPVASRRAMLAALSVAPVAAISANISLSSLPQPVAYSKTEAGDGPINLCRSSAGRALSRCRYHNAEGFFRSLEDASSDSMRQLLYRAGIVAQLALSSHLLDVGFADDWCARHIGLHVSKSLAHANATGFGHDCPQMAQLADVLTPYSTWNAPSSLDNPLAADGGFTARDISALLRALLDHVHHVTGHPRPRGWREWHMFR